MSEFNLGARIAAFRDQQGITQEELARRTGFTPGYVRQIEGGRRAASNAATLVRFAQGLGLRDVAMLTGGYPWSVQLEDNLRLLHPAARAMDDLLRRPPLSFDGQDAEAVDVDGIRARLTQQWDTWHTHPSFYTEVAQTLPSIVVDAQHAVAAGGGRSEWALLAESYFLVRQWLRKTNESEAASLAAERALHASQMAADPVLIAMSAWNLIGQHNAAGRYEASLDVARDGIDLADKHLARAAGEEQARRLLGMKGALWLYAAIAAARLEDPDNAWACWDQGGTPSAASWARPSSTRGRPTPR
ncbi:helix-turn-helix transcriptional regulator [Nonomuraea salmonea]|uniref:helix-turn-helix domain-containing protein n=1 Tax=Nonomuraea salmonea TaxID=46181 RepID=UPI002FED4E9C